MKYPKKWKKTKNIIENYMIILNKKIKSHIK